MEEPPVGMEPVSCETFRAAKAPPAEHAEICAGCAAWLADQQAARTALATLASELDAARPADVEQHLRVAFRTAPKGGRGGRRWLAAAAALLLAAGGFWRWEARPRGGDPDRDEVVFALRPQESPLAMEGGQVVRVRLSGPALRAMGLASGDDLPLGDVEADVLVGYDGVARAVRLASKQ